eukprot:145219-Pelagomonas_calceolata.AAC.6
MKRHARCLGLHGMLLLERLSRRTDARSCKATGPGNRGAPQSVMQQNIRQEQQACSSWLPHSGLNFLVQCFMGAKI